MPQKPPPTEIPVFGRLLLVRDGHSNCIVQPGKCFRMLDGSFSQLIVPGPPR